MLKHEKKREERVQKVEKDHFSRDNKMRICWKAGEMSCNTVEESNKKEKYISVNFEVPRSALYDLEGSKKAKRMNNTRLTIFEGSRELKTSVEEKK